MKRLLMYLVAALMMAGCTTKGDYVLFNDTNVTTPQAKESVTKLDDRRYEYRIAPHDRLSITMYNHPELGTASVQSQKQDTRGVLVNSRGYIRMPLVKSIHVAGLTQTSAQKKIEKAYKAYLEDAEVYLEVLNKRAYIIGEVNKPGPIPLLNEKAPLIQMIAMGGDLTDAANRKAVVILKKRRNRVLTQTVDLTGLNSLKLANLMVYPNDIVYVTPNNMRTFNVGAAEFTSIFGSVGQIAQPLANIKYLSE